MTGLRSTVTPLRSLRIPCRSLPSRLSRTTTVLALATLLATAPAAGQLTSIEGLGSLSFPNSGAQEAQEDFARGVLLLHSFEYGSAAQAFRRAQEADPDFALAYWGEAMTYTHPVWNQKDPEAARLALARFAPTPADRAARTPTARERAYMEAVDVLYGDGPKARLDTLYSVAMARLAQDHPADMEAQTFYALSLLGLSQGARDVPRYMEAGTIALKALEKNPDHPGAAHYTIHAFDDPTHAVLAQEAAELYGPMAPDAAHAQHMTTHIFLARGMWDRVVEANIRADGVVDRNRSARDLPPTDCGHYNEWLMYGYQQQGRYDAALDLLMGCHDQAADPASDRPGYNRNSYPYMRNLHLADARDFDGRAAHGELDLADAPLVLQLMQAWGSGVAAAHRGETALAREHARFLKEKGGDVDASYVSPYVPVWQGTLDALLLSDGGDLDGALASARGAADYEAALPVDFGPPIAFKPARELEAEILMDLDRPDDAMSAFRQQLGRTPNRILTLAGYARAAVAADHPAVATDAYGLLSELLANADSDVPEAREARTHLSSRAEEPGGSP